MSFNESERATLLRSLRGYAERMEHLGVQGVAVATKAAGSSAELPYEERVEQSFCVFEDVGVVSLIGDTFQCWVVLKRSQGADSHTGHPLIGEARLMFEKMVKHVLGIELNNVRVVDFSNGAILQGRPNDETSAVAKFITEESTTKPDLILAMGEAALHALVGAKPSLPSARGRWSQVAGIPVLATFHPKYLLRNPEHKRVVFTDLQSFKARMSAL